ncbi:XRE family transcriptional regulator [Sphingomonas sp. RG327]|jgi:transcriptional regulator with XRE-family HTH domain|uniref:XRE family transcriptional regulator n=1 Tax=Sphingomonas anseongensis TaxID=2908207 RepID=A0ABT0RHD6_9SPHN|nr:XRE family transcriptional regulator [Sphingomonas anseongensis]MCL6679690.1 XRE family transcriptional regulator [Sphingomonas anseongensis]
MVGSHSDNGVSGGRGATDDDVPAPTRAIRQARLNQGLSLRALSARAGLPYSTLSKLENGKMALTYDKLIRLAQALNVDLKDIIAEGEQANAPVAVGRRSVTRSGQELDAQSERHVHHYPAAELLGKMMIPIIIDVQARSVEELGGLVRHAGEEYLYVLKGTMELHSDLYAPLNLGPGDSVYFDSGMAHGYVRTSAGPCSVLAVCAGPGIQQLAGTAGKAWRLSEHGLHRID